MFSVKKLLHEAYYGGREVRNTGNIHASDLDRDFCPRKFALLDTVEEDLPKEYREVCLWYTFDMGYYIENLLREKLADRVYSEWCCTMCRFLSVGFRPKVCKHCNKGTAFTSKNLVFRSQVSGLVGSPDLLVADDNGLLHVIEVKSIKHDEFKTLAAPKGDHRVRTTHYLKIIEESDSCHKELINKTTALIVYCCKGYGSVNTQRDLVPDKMSPFREYALKRNDTLLLKREAPLVGYHEFLKSGIMPDRICASENSKLALECPLSKHCFKETCND